jgi:beta-lactamase regulating signal transducer with metallopeptidase domain
MTAWMLTWLWQGSAVAAAVAIALHRAPRLNAATRHVIWCGALAAVAWLGWTGSPHVATALNGCAADVDGAVRLVTGGTGLQPCLGAEPVLYVPSAPDLLVSIFIGIWAAVALVKLVRVLPALHIVYSLRDRCLPFPPELESRLPLWLEAKGRGRHADLLACDAVQGATVLGLQRPTIAIPHALIDVLTSDQLDQVILHEHAHVQRRDDWTRLVETLVLAVLWIHPAALFIARALNREREMACDEWVIARTGEAKAYARCLARAAELRGRMRSGSSLAPALLERRHELIRRVDRLLDTNGTARRNVSLAGVAAAACAIALMSSQLHGVRFAEIAAIVLPHVPGPMMALYGGPTVAIAQMPVIPRRVRLEANTPAAVELNTTDNAAALDFIATDAPNARPAPDAPVLSARAFHSLAPIAPDAPIAPVAPVAAPVAPVAPVAPNRWSSPGIEIASAAKKTSMGVANVLSRAGVSLARSF